MLLTKQTQILVFKVDNNTFDNIGEVNQFDGLIWPDKYNGFSTFELWAPITPENSVYFQKGNILWCRGNNAAIIEIVKSMVDSDGTKSYNVKGRTLEMLLTTRIVWGTHNSIGKKVSTIMLDIVRENCISPSNPNRKIPFLELGDDPMVGPTTSYQKTGGEVYDSVYSLASSCDLGFSILFRPMEKKLIFTVVEGVDRTIDQSEVSPVEFSTDLEDILSSTYYSNDQDKKTVALVQGEGEGENRVSQVAGVSSGVGFSRRELYVDARDIQSEVFENGSSSQIPPEEYSELLIQRGDEKLADCITTETFEAQIRVFGQVQYEFGVDYNKGDKVTIRDNQLGVVISARITEVQENFSESYSLELTFGYSYPTLINKVGKMISR